MSVTINQKDPIRSVFVKKNDNEWDQYPLIPAHVQAVEVEVDNGTTEDEQDWSNGEQNVQEFYRDGIIVEDYQVIESLETYSTDLLSMITQVVNEHGLQQLQEEWNQVILSASAQLESTISALTEAQTYLTISSAASTYLTQVNAGTIYLTQADADQMYLTKSLASSNYLTQTNAANTYLTKSSAANTYLTQSNAATTYALKSIKVAGNTLTGNITGGTFTNAVAFNGTTTFNGATTFANTAYNTQSSISDGTIAFRNIVVVGSSTASTDFDYSVGTVILQRKN